MNKKLNIFSAFILGIAYIICHQLVGLIFLFNTLFEIDSSNLILWVDSVLTTTHRVLFLILILLFLSRIKLLKPIIVNLKQKVKWTYILGSAITGVLFLFAQYPLNYISGIICRHEFSWIVGSSQLNSWNIPIIISSISVVVLTQELFFRGFILNSLTTKYGNTTALLMSSFLFAITHLSSFNTIYLTFLGGLIAGGIYIKTNKVLLPIIFHAFWNLTAHILKYI